MKKLPAIFFTLFLGTTGALQAEETPSTQNGYGSITIHITDLKKCVGQLGVSLFNAKKGFPSDYSKACATSLKNITASSDEVVFTNLPYGTYAVSVLHDENSNGKLDTTFLIGIPKEGIGVSNNPKARRGPPKYDECMFTLDSKQHEVTIAMKYF